MSPYANRNGQPRMFAELDVDWSGMPEYVQEHQGAWKTLSVNFRDEDAYEEFRKLVGQPITHQTRSIWYPTADRIKKKGVKQYGADGSRMPRYPIYIVSKGRSDRCITSRELERRGIPHHVIVEAKERDLYISRLGPLANVLVLPDDYHSRYDPCDGLGLSKSLGPGPARNFAWDHAVVAHAEWHWVMDDNISGFYRMNRNLKVPASGGAIFAAMEAFLERYENTAMGGPVYHGLTHQRDPRPPYVLNTRIYSCNLIRNDLPYRWRGRYNEDTDLSLRMLKDGLVTVQFNAFLQHKAMTQTMRGGNTEDFYAEEGTLPKSQMLELLHPDVATVIFRFGRWHHFVNYRPFKANTLRLKPGISIPDGPDEFGMVYQERPDEDAAWHDLDLHGPGAA